LRPRSRPQLAGRGSRPRRPQPSDRGYNGRVAVGCFLSPFNPRAAWGTPPHPRLRLKLRMSGPVSLLRSAEPRARPRRMLPLREDVPRQGAICRNELTSGLRRDSVCLDATVAFGSMDLPDEKHECPSGPHGMIYRPKGGRPVQMC